MRRLRDISIRTKLVLAILIVSSAAMLTGWFIDLLQENRSLRAELENSVAAQASLIGEYAISPLTFDDRAGTEVILAKAGAVGCICDLALYDTSGRLHARFARHPPSPFPGSLEVFQRDGFVDGSYYSRHEVAQRDQIYGTLLVRAST